jgi:hypothetical protein
MLDIGDFSVEKIEVFGLGHSPSGKDHIAFVGDAASHVIKECPAVLSLIDCEDGDEMDS